MSEMKSRYLDIWNEIQTLRYLERIPDTEVLGMKSRHLDIWNEIKTLECQR